MESVESPLAVVRTTLALDVLVLFLFELVVVGQLLVPVNILRGVYHYLLLPSHLHALGLTVRLHHP